MSEEGLPQNDQWKRLHPLSILLGALTALSQAAIPLAFVVISSSAAGSQFLIVLGAVLLILLFSQGFTYLSWRKKRYRVGAQDIRMESGILSREARSVPYERIQDVSLEQKLLPRLFGLAVVRFETGAGGKDDLKLAYVDLAQAERLREVVRVRREGAQAQTEAQTHEEQEGDLLFAMDEKRLFTFGLFEFSLVLFAILGGVFGQFAELIPEGYFTSLLMEDQLSESGQWLLGLGLGVQIIGALIGLAGLIVLGVVSGIIKTFIRDWQFRLNRTDKGFRRRRGLLTKTDVVMPVHRVQATTVSTGFLRRIWGWHGLSFISLAQDAKSANHAVAPFAQMEEIEPIVQAAQFTLPPQDQSWQRPSGKYRRDIAILSAAIPTLFGLGLIAFGQSLLGGFALLALAGFLAARQMFLWRYERHALQDSQVLSRRGWLAPRLIISNRAKLQSVEIKQGPLGKRGGYADLHLGLAGGRFTLPGLAVDQAEKLRCAILDSIAAVDFSRLPR